VSTSLLWTLATVASLAAQLPAAVVDTARHVAASSPAGQRAPAKTVTIGPASYLPFVPKTDKKVDVAAFRLDVFPVTNADYLAFVRAHAKWQRSRVAPLFADAQYLASWRDDLDLGVADPKAPVVEVSWFAARAYCSARGGRLPTENEWELAAAASPTRKDAREDPAWTAQILAWYERPSPSQLPVVGRGLANAWGVHDLHGLVWEWVEDFNDTLVTGDDRSRSDQQTMKFCGAGAANVNDVRDYASFMRFAMRGSLRASYVTSHLGFRCAESIEKEISR
jgi:formylglycine-generating enzyme required for sulfatase activity